MCAVLTVQSLVLVLMYNFGRNAPRLIQAVRILEGMFSAGVAGAVQAGVSPGRTVRQLFRVVI